MRSVVCDDETFARLVGDGDLYDYELGERYVMAPAAGTSHALLQARIIACLTRSLPDYETSGPANLGLLGQPGRRWYVVPDAVVFRPDVSTDDDANLLAVIAVEIRSPREDAVGKLADYRAVMERTGLVVDEVWYVDGEAVNVYPNAQTDTGSTNHPNTLAAVLGTVRNWYQQQR